MVDPRIEQLECDGEALMSERDVALARVVDLERDLAEACALAQAPCTDCPWRARVAELEAALGARDVHRTPEAGTAYEARLHSMAEKLNANARVFEENEEKQRTGQAVTEARALPPGISLMNGGLVCDMITGPCACGATHSWDEWADRLWRARPTQATVADRISRIAVDHVDGNGNVPSGYLVQLANDLRACPTKPVVDVAREAEIQKELLERYQALEEFAGYVRSWSKDDDGDFASYVIRGLEALDNTTDDPASFTRPNPCTDYARPDGLARHLRGLLEKAIEHLEAVPARHRPGLQALSALKGGLRLVEPVASADVDAFVHRAVRVHDMDRADVLPFVDELLELRRQRSETPVLPNETTGGNAKKGT